MGHNPNNYMLHTSKFMLIQYMQAFSGTQPCRWGNITQNCAAQQHLVYNCTTKFSKILFTRHSVK